MMSNFWSRPRKAPGFPDDCADAGDMLARAVGQDVTVLVVTSALRSAIESLGDPARGLAQVRGVLHAVGSHLPATYRVGYYGKDLVTLLPGVHSDLTMDVGRLAMAIAPSTQHGWAWTPVRSATLPALLEGCYRASVGARVRRDYPYLVESDAIAALEQWRTRMRAESNSGEVASKFAAVVVRPYGTANQPVARDGDDPRWPGVSSADGLASTVIDRVGLALNNALYVVTDVHDIEWGGTFYRKAPKEARWLTRCQVSEGNAARLLPLASAWLAGRIRTDDALNIAYKDRLSRERRLAQHLCQLAGNPPGLFGTLGDGLEGIVESNEYLCQVIAKANAYPRQFRSGIGASLLADCISGDQSRACTNGLESGMAVDHATSIWVEARKRALFSLHVTKTLKHSDSPQAELHVFGSPLSRTEEDALLAFLRDRREAGLRSAGYHHVRHAQINLKFWSQHLTKTCYGELVRIVKAI